MEIRHLLVPTDFSPPAHQAMTYALELARKVGAKLSLLHVIEVPVYAIEVALPRHELEQEARRGLAHMLPEAAAADVDVTRLVALGVPYEQILQMATAEQVDLIVMATHGRTGLWHLALGSVAERVVRLARCPVLTIRSPGQDPVGLRRTLI